MLFREPSLTSLRRDFARIQNGWFATGFPRLYLSLSLSLSSPPGTLIYVRRYLCQWIYISIFIIRNIIARAFIALVEMPSPRRLQPSSSFHLFLSARFSSFFRLDPFAGRHARCSISQELVSVVSHLQENIYYAKTRVERTRRIKLIDTSRG